MLFGFLAVNLFQVVDTYYIARLGAAPLAAIGFVFPIVSLVFAISSGLGEGMMSTLSRAMGQKNQAQIRQLTSHGLVLALLFTIAAVMVGMLGLNMSLSLLGAKGVPKALAFDYMTVWYLGMVCLVIPVVGNSAIRATGDTKYPAKLMVFAAVMNMGLDPIFIFGWGPVPAMGIQGAAWASLLARACTLAASIYYLYKKSMITVFMGSLSAMVASWRSILVIALPACLNNMVIPLAMGVITYLMAQYSAAHVAGFGVAMKVEAFAMILFYALSVGSVVLIGPNWGRGLYQRVLQTCRWVYGVSFLLGLVLFGLFWLLAPTIAKAFHSDPAIVRIASAYLMMVSLSYGCFGIWMFAVRGFNVTGQSMKATVLVVLRMAVLYIPLAWVGHVFFQVQGIFAAALMTNFLACIVSIAWLETVLRAKIYS
jgi:putative MATE family efflux protein